MNKKLNNWFSVIKNNKKKLLVSLFFLIIAIVSYLSVGDYVSESKNYVVAPDIILDTFGPYDLSFLFIWLFVLVLSLYFLYPLIYKPREFPYVVSMFSLFVIIRSGFILLTHLQVPYDAIILNYKGIFQLLNFSNDLFFSGHTGLPFLGFLIHKDHKGLRYFMLISSIILGITVLLMHIHYSIDVFSAFFITYGIYVFGNKFIKRVSILN